jgi:uroporphyrinogen III methyltransferase/synthase
VLPRTLREAGRLVDVAAAYRTRFVDDPGLRAKIEAADIVTFTSSSTVQGLVYNLADAPRLLLRKLVATIGPVTAKTALSLGIRVDAIPDEYTIEGLLAVLGAVTA